MSPNDFIEARQRLSPYLQPTPMLKSEKLQQRLGYDGEIFLKLECEQPTGSFKVRGAFNALLQLDPSIKKVVAFSSGNFAQAVAYGASKLNKKAIIVMPQNAPKKKIEGTKSLGAEIVFGTNRHEDGDRIVQELVAKEGCFALHPFNNYHTIAGQGTIALEVLDSHPQMKHFFSPVGGGGLLSGCASAIKAANKTIATYAVEPIGAEDFYQSFQEKRHIAFEKIDTIADGLRAISVGEFNFPILMAHVDDAIAVSEASIIDAMRFLWEEHGLIIEPSGAVALAGFISINKNIKGDVVILVTGKNVDLDAFNKWVGVNIK